MRETWRIILSGSGGQGLGIGGKILAEAALFQGLNASQSQTYGARARGGFSQSGVIISRQEILFPLIEKPDLLVVLSQKAYSVIPSSFFSDVILVYDLDSACPPINKTASNNAYGFQMVKKAREIFDEKGVAILAVGIIVALFKPVEEDCILLALEKNFSGASVWKNRHCFQEGLQMAGKHPPAGFVNTDNKT